MALQDPNMMPSSRLGCPLSLKTHNMGNPGFYPSASKQAAGIFVRKGFPHPVSQAAFWARVVDDGHIKVKKKRLLASEMRPPRRCGDDMPELLPPLRNFLIHPQSVNVNEPMRWKTAPIDLAWPTLRLSCYPKSILTVQSQRLKTLGRKWIS